MTNVLWGYDSVFDHYSAQRLPYEKSGLEISIKDPMNIVVDLKHEMRKVEQIFKRGNHFLAIKILEDLKAKTMMNEQHNQRINYLLPLFYQKVGFLKTAKSLYQKELQKGNRKMVRNFANLIYKQGTKKSFKELDRLSEKYSYSPYVFENMAKLQIKSKNFSDALNHYLRAYYIDRNNIVYLYNIGVLMERLRNLPMAIMIYNKVVNALNNNGGAGHVQIDSYRLLRKIDTLTQFINN